VDEDNLGAKVRHSMNEKFLQSYQYSAIRLEDIDQVMNARGFQLTPDTTPLEIANFAEDKLEARYVFWGFCKRDREKRLGWTIRFLGMDVEDSREEIKWDKEAYVTTYNEVRLALNRFATEISGYQRRIGLEPEVPAGKQRPYPRRNLVRNGGFEEGDETPKYWETIDNLTTFYEKTGGNPGRCLRVNTDVLDDQAMEWKQAVRNGADFRKPPERKPTKPPKYDTIAGLHGVHYHSDPIPIKRGVIYRVTVDLKGPEGAKVFTKGYAAFEATRFAAQDREIYRNYLACKQTGEDIGGGWKRYTRTFLPNAFYSVFDLENRAGTDDALLAAQFLRRRLKARNFPLMPYEEQKRRLSKIRFDAKYDTPMPELIATVRDRLMAAHAIYGKVDRGEEGLTLYLRLMSTRIKQNIPIIDQEYPLKHNMSTAMAVKDFLDRCEKRFPFVDYVRVIPYPYWPPGMYFWDNVTLTEEGDTLW